MDNRRSIRRRSAFLIALHIMGAGAAGVVAYLYNDMYTLSFVILSVICGGVLCAAKIMGHGWYGLSIARFFIRGGQLWTILACISAIRFALF
ncbi:hypothetical protein COU18_01645 [Candidatus Kaiserbacteria bacterium CG10_big_fil_rev_8_21_14_0_10_51_14]|uniref:Uncharacterized protein n=1 Tax=Candidatus Kaiserbacteria bacterium CG10_big_fil_rev_8_21_14_0_10_51_14 TaxID=1974610 RepID=A0A2H0UE78_9BACT|nr:MAG: hypothetical protein COU18_01645 [Candidatus Kaiserbacteria bacterium CG10_big_fil_rev_8_21_14_0_10_51_14]